MILKFLMLMVYNILLKILRGYVLRIYLQDGNMIYLLSMVENERVIIWVEYCAEMMIINVFSMRDFVTI